MAAQHSPFDRLWHDYQRTGDERLKADLTSQFMPILVPMARRVRRAMGGHPDLDDLVHAGVVGLLEAFKRFDPARGVSFEAYCGWRVLGAMHDDQRKFDWAPGALRLKAQRLRAAAADLEGRLCRRPSDEELAEALGVALPDVAQARRHAEHKAPLSIDRATGASLRAAEDAMADGRGDPVRRIAAQEARTLLLDHLKRLDDKPRYVLLLYYFEKLTMAQIGLVLKLSESRVCQIHAEALKTLLRRLGPRRDELLDALAE